MADLTVVCCECLEPMVPDELPLAQSGERWYRCSTHGYWEESEIGAYVYTLSAYEQLRRDGSPTLPGLEGAG